MRNFAYMINPKIIFLFLIGVAALCWACKPADTPDKTADEIVAEVSRGNFDAAMARANDLMARRDGAVDSMRVERLCGLAVAMVRLGEHSEKADEFTAFALKCYRRALTSAPDATEAYVDELTSDDYRYISFLNQLLRPVDAREAGVVYSINEDGEDSTVDSIAHVHAHGIQ